VTEEKKGLIVFNIVIKCLSKNVRTYRKISAGFMYGFQVVNSKRADRWTRYKKK